MQITIHPDVEERLKEIHAGDLERLINDIALVYATGGFIRESDLVGRFHLKDIFRKSAEHLAPVFDETTHEFQGFAIVSKTESETLWVVNEDLHNAIEENTVVLVVRSPRKKGIRRKKGPSIEARNLLKSELS